LKKGKKTKPNAGKKKEIIKIRAEVNKIKE
jgi:hypothetical protein